MKLDMHIHSKYSYDSFLEPSTILRIAKRKGIDVISITDHDSVEVYKALSPGPSGVMVIPGVEVKTDMGDVIGLFVEEEVRSRSLHSVAEEIKRAGGIIVLPHPYRRSCGPEGLARHADLVEVLNARSREADNAMARELCEAYGKKAISGSDAHAYFEIGRVVTEIDHMVDSPEELRKILLTADRRCHGKATNYLVSHGYSFLASRIKKVVSA